MRMSSATISASSPSLVASASCDRKGFLQQSVVIDDYLPLDLPLWRRNPPLFEHSIPSGQTSDLIPVAEAATVASTSSIRPIIAQTRDPQSSRPHSKSAPKPINPHLERTSPPSRPTAVHLSERPHSEEVVDHSFVLQSKSKRDLVILTEKGGHHNCDLEPNEANAIVIDATHDQSHHLNLFQRDFCPDNIFSDTHESHLHHDYSSTDSVVVGERIPGANSFTTSKYIQDSDASFKCNLLVGVQTNFPQPDSAFSASVFFQDQQSFFQVADNRISSFRLLREIYPVQSNKMLVTVYDYESKVVSTMMESAEKREEKVNATSFEDMKVCLHTLNIPEMNKNDKEVYGKVGGNGIWNIFTTGVKMSDLNFTHKVDLTQCSEGVWKNVSKNIDPNFGQVIMKPLGATMLGGILKKFGVVFASPPDRLCLEGKYGVGSIHGRIQINDEELARFVDNMDEYNSRITTYADWKYFILIYLHKTTIENIYRYWEGVCHIEIAEHAVIPEGIRKYVNESKYLSTSGMAGATSSLDRLKVAMLVQIKNIQFIPVITDMWKEGCFLGFFREKRDIGVSGRLIVGGSIHGNMQNSGRLKQSIPLMNELVDIHRGHKIFDPGGFSR